ncbi:MAG: signal peptide peptidase SppA [Desulfatibacillaceae bacterium]
MRVKWFVAAAALLLLTPGCFFPRITLFPDPAAKLVESRIEGDEDVDGKVVVIDVHGFIGTQPDEGLMRDRPSVVEEVVARLDKAEQDEEIKAVVLKVNSPGGSATASDILYDRIIRFKEKTSASVVAVFMDVAASGGYYVSLPANHIVAHPTSVTGSVGVILIRPRVHGLMDKIGVAAEVSKSGELKDMGSPFREPTKQEREIFQATADRLADRFMSLVHQHRSLDDEGFATIATARIFLAEEALQLGLVDQVGYLDDGLDKAKELADLPEDAEVVMYRRRHYEEDNLYRAPNLSAPGRRPALVDIGLPDLGPRLPGGFYYLWEPGMR